MSLKYLTFFTLALGALSNLSSLAMDKNLNSEDPDKLSFSFTCNYKSEAFLSANNETFITNKITETSNFTLPHSAIYSSLPWTLEETIHNFLPYYKKPFVVGKKYSYEIFGYFTLTKIIFEPQDTSQRTAFSWDSSDFDKIRNLSDIKALTEGFFEKNSNMLIKNDKWYVDLDDIISGNLSSFAYGAKFCNLGVKNTEVLKILQKESLVKMIRNTDVFKVLPREVFNGPDFLEVKFEFTTNSPPKNINNKS